MNLSSCEDVRALIKKKFHPKKKKTYFNITIYLSRSPSWCSIIKGQSNSPLLHHFTQLLAHHLFITKSSRLSISPTSSICRDFKDRSNLNGRLLKIQAGTSNNEYGLLRKRWSSCSNSYPQRSVLVPDFLC